MKNLKRILVQVLVVLVFAVGAYAQETSSADVEVILVTPMALNKTADMNFGNVAVAAAAGTVVLSPAAVRSVTGGIVLPAVAGTVSAASFNVIGEGSYTYAISLPSSVTITHTNTVNTMVVDSFTSSPSGTGELVTGAQALTVGATLNVGAEQLMGAYTTGSVFDVTVNYN